MPVGGNFKSPCAWSMKARNNSPRPSKKKSFITLSCPTRSASSTTSFHNCWKKNTEFITPACSKLLIFEQPFLVRLQWKLCNTLENLATNLCCLLRMLPLLPSFDYRCTVHYCPIKKGNYFCSNFSLIIQLHCQTKHAGQSVMTFNFLRYIIRFKILNAKVCKKILKKDGQ